MNCERYWLCWSFRQACPHIESEAEGLRINIQAFKENRGVDYVPISVFNSMEEANALADRLRDVMRKRHAVRVRADEAKRKAEEAKWKSRS